MALQPPDVAEILGLLESAQEKSAALIRTNTFSTNPQYAGVVRGLEHQITAAKHLAQTILTAARDDEAAGRSRTRL